jgi:hypothetical protein
MTASTPRHCGICAFTFDSDPKITFTMEATELDEPFSKDGRVFLRSEPDCFFEV